MQTQENGKTTTHRNTHNIKFNIKLYINNDGQRQRRSKNTEEKKNRKSRKYLRVNCLI